MVPRTPTAPPTDRSMWRRLLARAHPDRGGDHDLFIWTDALREYVVGSHSESPIHVRPRRTRPSGSPRVPYGAAFESACGFGLRLRRVGPPRLTHSGGSGGALSHPAPAPGRLPHRDGGRHGPLPPEAPGRNLQGSRSHRVQGGHGQDGAHPLVQDRGGRAPVAETRGAPHPEQARGGGSIDGRAGAPVLGARCVAKARTSRA
jgi:hypothetical protein